VPDSDKLTTALAEIRERYRRGDPERVSEALAEVHGGPQDVPRLLAAVDEVLELADGLRSVVLTESALTEDRSWIRNECGDLIVQAISRALLGEDT
jgi:hypothetical protein